MSTIFRPAFTDSILKLMPYWYPYYLCRSPAEHEEEVVICGRNSIAAGFSKKEVLKPVLLKDATAAAFSLFLMSPAPLIGCELAAPP